MRYAFLSLIALACAPVVDSVQLVNADLAIDAAESAGARRYAVYEYTMAQEYLSKAREESGYSDFSAARVYADKAIHYAVSAHSLALEFTGRHDQGTLPANNVGTPP